MIKHRNITKIQDKFLSSYLEKSKDTLEDFLEGEEREIAEWKDLGWIEYSKYDNILWIHTAYNVGKPHKEVKQVWDNLKELAKENRAKTQPRFKEQIDRSKAPAFRSTKKKGGRVGRPKGVGRATKGFGKAMKRGK